jgi:hypothetical protein
MIAELETERLGLHLRVPSDWTTQRDDEREYACEKFVE